MVRVLAPAPCFFSAQETSGREPTVKQVASDVYFFIDYDGSNSVFLVTEEGVLVIDTRTHPREASDLLALICKVTEKPIKWVINSHFHGDHHMGNAIFKAERSTFVAELIDLAVQTTFLCHTNLVPPPPSQIVTIAAEAAQ